MHTIFLVKIVYKYGKHTFYTISSTNIHFTLLQGNKHTNNWILGKRLLFIFIRKYRIFLEVY